MDVLAVWDEAQEDDAIRTQVFEVLQAVLPGDKPGKQLREALAWLDGDAERWADLIRSIEWRLGEPELDAVRGRIAEALEAVEIRRRLSQQRPDAFQPDLAASLVFLAERLGTVGHPEEALAAADEAVRMLAPFFLRYPRAFEVGMKKNVHFYRKRCQESDHEPDLELLVPIVAALDSLQEEPAAGS